MSDVHCFVSSPSDRWMEDGNPVSVSISLSIVGEAVGEQYGNDGSVGGGGR